MLRSVLIALLVVSAGCLGGGVADPETTGDSPSATTTVPTDSPRADGSAADRETTNASATTWTPGDGIDADRLARHHFAALRDAGSFTVNHSESLRIEGETPPSIRRSEAFTPPSYARERVNLTAGRYLRTAVVVGGRRSDHFLTPAVTATRRRNCPTCAYEYSYQRRPEGDTVSQRLDRYRRHDAVAALARLLRGVTVGFDYAHVGTVERGGDTLHRYRAEKHLHTAPPPFDAPPRGIATVLVTERGVVRRVELRYVGPATVTVDGERRTVTVADVTVKTYTAVGNTTVTRPAWVDRAAAADPNRTTQTGER